VAAAELDGYRRAYGRHHPGPAEHGGGRVAQDGPAAVSATAPTAARDGSAGRSERAHWRPRTRRDPTAAEGRQRVDPGRLLGSEPRRDTPGRRRDWQTAWTSLERLADHNHGREDRYRPRERAGRPHGRDLGRQERYGR
jgi:hypothetical protein